METSMDSLMITSSSQEKREDNNNSLEESSWTFYIQDFLCENDTGNNKSSLSSSSNNNSCYDEIRASSAVQISNYQNDGRLNVNYERSKRNNNNNKKKNSRKRKVFNQGASMDDDLEDTASSPLNSPNKVSYMKDFEMKQKELSNAYLEEVERKRSSSRKFDVGEDNGDITELKKRGLCLVPLSSVANYFSYKLS
ncbi:hypothetical protein LIER_43336 [Lithospermum erythrorhizon]|uniref:Uncharacterized protein n=1 Tax=Lithospermum erythrorhizon TaxID=34254 RepID=A0AAV3PXD4_LITER